MGRGREKPTILLMDDDPPGRRALALALEGAGYITREAVPAQLAPAEAAGRGADLIILGMDASQASPVELIRAFDPPPLTPPILVLSPRAEEESKVAALDAGADDYMTKPFSLPELLARVRAILRRTRLPAAETYFRFGSIELDLALRRVLRDGQPVKLTATEFALLRLLVSNRDKVLTHRQMLRELWGIQAIASTNYLRIYMMRLRRKLGEDTVAAGHFQTESGVGYRFVSTPPPLPRTP
jgi:two-component system KDP operon response regulator KdpE